jgi:hypothetical protein
MVLGLPLAHIPSYFADHRHRRHDIDAIDLGQVRTGHANNSSRKLNWGSYERGCQEKKILPAPPEDAGVVTCIQPHLILIHRGVVGLVALARCRFQQRCQPQLLFPTQGFHEAVALDAVRSRSYAS